MYHIPQRKKPLHVNPWPVAVRRILWMIALLCGVAALRAILEWGADHLLANGRNPFNVTALLFLVPVAAIVAFLMLRGESQETWDTMGQQIQMFFINTLLAAGALYLLWDRLNLGPLFREEDPESYPFPYNGTIKLMATWFSMTIALQMAGTLLIAIMDTRGNRYEEDRELF